jgi:hypothetical protein
MCDTNNDPQTLATAAGLGSITICSCGTISLHIGGVSLRLDSTAFTLTAEMCRNALAALEHQASALQSMRPTASQMTH